LKFLWSHLRFTAKKMYQSLNYISMSWELTQGSAIVGTLRPFYFINKMFRCRCKKVENPWFSTFGTLRPFHWKNFKVSNTCYLEKRMWRQKKVGNPCTNKRSKQGLPFGAKTKKVENLFETLSIQQNVNMPNYKLVRKTLQRQKSWEPLFQQKFETRLAIWSEKGASHCLF